VKELHFELWRQRRQQLLREALKGRLVRKFRASQRRVSSRPDGRPDRQQDPRGPAGPERESSLQRYPNHRSKDQRVTVSLRSSARVTKIVRHAIQVFIGSN
jgi:hypothetical protein